MPRTSKLELSRDEIIKFMQSLPTKVFTYNELGEILSRQRAAWDLPDKASTGRFISFLEGAGDLHEIKLVSRNYGNLTRYVWKTPSIFAIALSIKKRAYLSHGTAVFLHGLTDLIPKTVYVNHEQSPKSTKGVLVQANIDRAFAGKQRQSNLIYEHEDYRITIVNGKWTDRLGVISKPDSDSTKLEVTNIERTLIDIAVRPSYAGGVFEVLKVYQSALNMVDIPSMVATLNALDYTYPYHQVIGFYMERAGYDEGAWSELRIRGLEFDFYLTYGLPRDRKYDSKWRIYYPDGF